MFIWFAYVLIQKGDYENSITFYKMDLQIPEYFPIGKSSTSILVDSRYYQNSVKKMDRYHFAGKAKTNYQVL